jgi:hypothetical protein
MPPLREPFCSVAAVWLLWLASLVSLILLTRSVLAGLRRRGIGHLLCCEDGAAYSLAYVLTVPFFAYLVCLAIETSLLLVVKMGTVYAAFAAARSAIVFRSYPPPGLAQAKARLAAAQALAPFASSSALHADGPKRGRAAADDFARAYRRTVRGSASPAYLRAKFMFAWKAARVMLEKPHAADANGRVRATVIYECPLHVPGIGRLLGRRSPWGGRYYTYRIESRAELPDEEPQAENRQLGICHGKR